MTYHGMPVSVSRQRAAGRARARRDMQEIREVLERGRPTHPAKPARDPVTLTLQPPRANIDQMDAYLGRWGAKHQADVHLAEGGWGFYRLPPMSEVWRHALKAADHKGALPYLAALSHAVIYSTSTLSEAAAFTSECARLTLTSEWARSFHSPANAWISFGIEIVNVWQARQQRCDSRHLGDTARIAECLHDIKTLCAEHHLAIYEADLTAKRTQWRIV